MKYICKPILIAVVIVFYGLQVCLSYDLNIQPADFQGGEGVFLRVDGSRIFDYKVLWMGKIYSLYKQNSGFKEIYLPIDIEVYGEKEIVVKKSILGIGMSATRLVLDVKKRKVKVSRLTGKDEKVRDRQASVKEQALRISESFAAKTQYRLWDSEFIIPVKGQITTPFAMKREGKKYSYYHKGIDIAALRGTMVYASNAGRVILAVENLNIYGNTVIVDHGQGVLSSYYHLDKVLVNENDMVNKETVIGKVGSTGWSTGNHLHFSIYLQGTAVDPLWWIEYTKTRI